jgi:RND family efflux transporter MFP subunit
MKKKWIYLAVAAALAVLGTVVYLRFSGTDAHAAPAAASVRVAAVAIAKEEPIVDTVTLSGEFRPFQVVDVHAKVAGYIRKIYVDVGDKVKAGQVMAVLEVPELSAQILGAEASVKRSEDAIRRAQSEMVRAKSSHAATHLAYSRLKQASDARPGLIAEQELDDALAKDQESEAQVESEAAALSEANNQLSIAQAERKQLAAMESYTQITAPFDAVVTKRYADTGSLIQSGTASNTQAMPVVQLAEWSKLRLVVPVPESAVSSIHLGTIVKVKVPDLNRAFEGKVARFADALSDETRTMHTEIDVDNKSGALVEGMYAETSVVLQHKDDALAIPTQAIARNGSKATVLIVDAQNRIEEREVTIGEEGNNRVEVTSGLKPDDRVVLGSRSEFRTGDRVQPKPVDTTEEGAQL